MLCERYLKDVTGVRKLRRNMKIYANDIWTPRANEKK
jgi:hypothetical protein